VGALFWTGPAVACCYPRNEPLAAPMNCPVPPPGEAASTMVVVLSPQQALTTYEAGALRQLTTLAAYSDKTTIEAEIPAIGGKGQCSLRRTFSEPQSLNVIYRVLASDVENVEKKTGQRVAILESNYRFSYKGIEDLNGRPL
jgi:hypothetical protein